MKEQYTNIERQVSAQWASFKEQGYTSAAATLQVETWEKSTKLNEFKKKCAIDLCYKWMNFGNDAKGKGYATVTLDGKVIAKNQLGNIAFAYLSVKCPPPGFDKLRETAVIWAYNHCGVGTSTYGGYWKANMGKYLGTPRSDNLAAFAVGWALAISPTLDRQSLERAFNGPTDKFKGLNDGFQAGKLTWIPEYGDDGFDTNTLKANNAPYKGPPSLTISTQLQATYKQDLSVSELEIDKFSVWANRWYEDYWGQGVPPLK